MFDKTKSNISYEEMEKLHNRISKIRKKKYLEEIRDIIVKYNPNIKITENSNGLYLCFQNLSNETYFKLSTYLKNLSKLINSKKSDTTHLNISSDQLTQSTDDLPFENDPKLKYTNKERNILKRKHYDAEIKNNNNLIDTSTTNNIFVKKIKN